MKIHELKVHPSYFIPLCTGEKSFEVRKNDRDFQVGDVLHLRPYNKEKSKIESERFNYGYCLAEIKHILLGNQFGIEKDYVVMALKVLSSKY